MDTSFGLGVCVFSLCILVAAHCSETEHDDITYYHMEGDHHIQEQKIMTRSVNPAVAKGMAAMEKLLSGAKSMRVTSTRFRKYEKQGDANTALKDFYSVQPANVQRKSAFSFGRGSTGDNSIIGQVGNKRLILRLSGDRLSTRYPVLEIRTATDPVFDRIVYKKPASD